MYNMNFLLVKAVQTDHLRNASQSRLGRLIEARRRAMRKPYPKKERR